MQAPLPTIVAVGYQVCDEAHQVHHLHLTIVTGGGALIVGTFDPITEAVEVDLEATLAYAGVLGALAQQQAGSMRGGHSRVEGDPDAWMGRGYL
jgi:hypothetical protein